VVARLKVVASIKEVARLKVVARLMEVARSTILFTKQQWESLLASSVYRGSRMST
jgi:hypothetical protein